MHFCFHWSGITETWKKLAPYWTSFGWQYWNNFGQQQTQACDAIHNKSTQDSEEFSAVTAPESAW